MVCRREEEGSEPEPLSFLGTPDVSVVVAEGVAVGGFPADKRW